jgi:hypothetical protein
MKSLVISLGFFALLGAGQTYADMVQLQVPTIGEIDPGLTNCMNLNDLADAVSSAPSGTGFVGEASFTSWVCKLRVHAGRGPGIRIFSGCGDVVWDSAGEIVSVSMRVVVTGYYLPAGC